MSEQNVLIAGTSRSHLEISKKMLRFHYEDCKVDLACSGNECIDKASKKSYDLFLFDFYLGDKDVLEVIRLLDVLGCRRPVLTLVDEGDEEKGELAVKQGAADFIVKSRGYLTALPFTIRDFMTKMKESETAKDLTMESSVRNMPNDHFILDKKGRILSADDRMVKITNYSADELIELSLVDLMPGEQENSFFEWMNSIADNGKSPAPFRTDILGKTGSRVRFDILLNPIRDQKENIMNYLGTVAHVEEIEVEEKAVAPGKGQFEIVNKLCEIVTTSYDEPLGEFLEKITEAACQVLRFQRSTIALLDKKKGVFIKQTMIGYGKGSAITQENIEVPKEVIDRIFGERFRVKVIYYNQDHRNISRYVNARHSERRTQRRRSPSEWHRKDLILVRLMDRNGGTFGYISLDSPLRGTLPNRSTFHNLELLSQLTSMAIENFYQFSSLERTSRRLKQVLVTSNIFKLYLSLNDLLKEVVWSIKFSLDFNLIALGLISKKTGRLEIKAVACDDKIKQHQMSELSFPLDKLANILKNSGKCWKIIFRQGRGRRHPALQKNILRS